MQATNQTSNLVEYEMGGVLVVSAPNMVAVVSSDVIPIPTRPNKTKDNLWPSLKDLL